MSDFLATETGSASVLLGRGSGGAVRPLPS